MNKNKSRVYNSSINIIWGIARQLVLLILAFSTRTIFVRLLGAEYTGVSGLYSNILTVLSLAEFGVGNVLLYSLYKPLKQNDISQIKALLIFYKKIYTVIALVVALVGVALVPGLRLIVNSNLPQDELIIFYLLYLANSVASYFAVYKTTLIQADQSVYLKNIIQTLFMVAQYSLQIIVLLVWQNFELYLCIQVLCTLGQNIVLSQITNKKYPFLLDSSITLAQIDKKQILSDTKSMFVYKLSSVLINNTDNILISTILGTVVVGYYTNYYVLITYVNLFINIIITGITASIGDLNAEGDRNKSFLIFLKLLFVFNLVAGFCTNCYIAIVQDFMNLWLGNQYLLDEKFILALMSNFYLVTVISPVWMYRETMGLFKQVKLVMFVAAVINIVLSILLGMHFGLSGIILSTTISRLVTIAWYEPYLLYKQFDQTVLKYYVQQLKYCIVNIAIFVSTCILNKYCVHVVSPILNVAIKLTIAISVWGMITMFLYHRKEEFRWFKTVMVSRLKKVKYYEK